MDIDIAGLAPSSGTIAGALGAFVYGCLRPAKTLKGILVQYAAGAISAQYLSVPFIDYFAVPMGYQNFVIFSVGVFGLAVVGGILSAVENYDFTKLLPGKKVGE